VLLLRLSFIHGPPRRPGRERRVRLAGGGAKGANAAAVEGQEAPWRGGGPRPTRSAAPEPLAATDRQPALLAGAGAKKIRASERAALTHVTVVP
jgi:hypothetical protein